VIPHWQCKKDNTDIVRNTLGTLLNTKLKQICKWGVVSIVDGEVECRGGRGDTARQTIPVELFMAGDILFYAIALGKEGLVTWWCNWCHLFKNQMTSSRPPSSWNFLEHGVIEGPCFENRERRT
jgi:hypothetical protein